MFYEFLYPLKNWFFPFNVFRYITFRAVYSIVTAFLIAVWIAPKFIRFMRKKAIGQYEKEYGPKSHLAKQGTPTMGGVFILISLTTTLILWGNFHNEYTWITLLAGILFGLVGFIDDYLKFTRKNGDGLSAKAKMVLLIFSAVVIVGLIFAKDYGKSNQLTLFYLPFISEPVMDLGKIGAFGFFVLVIVASSNAVNLADGLDGLAAGLSIILYATYGVFVYLAGHHIASSYLKIPFINGAGELAVVSASMIGALAGFLWFNAHPAQVFMGDTGSLSIGAVVGTLAIISKHEMLLIIAGGVFVIITLSVIIQVGYYKITKKISGKGKRIFKMAPLHHHFEQKGWSETQIVVRLWIIGGAFALLALSSLKIR